MKKRFWAVAAAACVAAVSYGGGVPAVQAAASSGAAVQAAASTPHTYLGVYELGVPQTSWRVTRFAHAIGYKPRLVMYYSGWGEQFQAKFAEKTYADGGMPLVQIDPTNISFWAIVNGRYDSYLKSYARQVKAYGHRVVIGFAHEMNGWWYSWGHGHVAPRTWVKAWRHVVTVFRKQGATNVTWLWTIDRNPGAKNVIPQYWPGGSYVNWVGIDGYYFTKSQTFATIFAPIIAVVRKLTGKPILLAETGIGQVAGQAAKMPDLFNGIHKYHLIGLVWYDVCQHGGLYHQCWRLEGHPAAIRAFRAGLKLINAS